MFMLPTVEVYKKMNGTVIWFHLQWKDTIRKQIHGKDQHEIWEHLQFWDVNLAHSNSQATRNIFCWTEKKNFLHKGLVLLDLKYNLKQLQKA